MNEEGINQGIQTASKVVGGLSFTTAATSSWWAMSVPWSDIAIIVSAVGGVFFMCERACSLYLKIREVRNAIKD